MRYKFRWDILFDAPYLGWLIDGVKKTLLIGSAAWVIALIAGVVVGLFRVLPSRPLRAIGTGYVELFRNIPLLVQLFLWYYAVPPMLGTKFLRLPNLNLYVAVVGLGIYTAARVAEHVRSGLSSVGRGQYWAGSSTGLTQYQLYRFIIVPHALRIAIPPITTEFLTIFKNSSLALTIGVLETTGAANRVSSFTFQGIEALTAAMVVYLTIGLTVVGLMSMIERYTRIPGLYGRD